MATGAAIELFFNEAVQPGAALDAIELTDDTGRPVPFHPVLGAPGQRLTLILEVALEQGAAYRASVPELAVTSQATGSGLSAPYHTRFRIAQPGTPQLHLGVYPIRVMEGSRIRVSVWYESPVDHDREVSLSGTPTGELLSLSPITIPAGGVLGEAWIDTRLNHASFSDVAATLQASEPSAGTVSQGITIHNYTGTTAVPLTFLAVGISNDTDGDGAFEAGETANANFEVANFSGSSISNVVITLRVLNATGLRILGGTPFQCNLGTMPANAVRTCTRSLLARSDLPSGDYFVELVGTSSTATMIDQGRIPIVNRSQPDLALTVSSIASNPLPPGTVVNYRLSATSSGGGFVYPPASPPYFRVELEVEGRRTVLYDRVYANIRGDTFLSESFSLPIVYPTTPGTHAIYSRIDPQGLVTESNETNNDGDVKFITVRAPNQAPQFKALGGPWSATAGTSLCQLVSALDPDGNTLTFHLLSAPPSATLTPVSTTSARFCWTPTEADGPATHPVAFEVIDNGSPPLSDFASTSVVVSLLSDVAVAVTDGLAQAVPGQSLSYSIAVANGGPHRVSNLSLHDRFPMALEGVGWTCTGSAGATCSAAGGSGDLSVSTSLPTGGRITVVASGTLQSQAAGVLANQATATLPTGWTDPTPGDQQATDSTLLLGLDWGDAPDASVASNWAFPVRLVAGGARHGVVAGIHLGGALDAEPDGVPDSMAWGDDQAGVDDEDGVIMPAELVICSTVGLAVTASASGRLDGWIDWNGDGLWSEPAERIAASTPLAAGSQVLLVAVPCDARIAPATYGRFRFSSFGGLSPAGLALDGEVEDYRTAVAAHSDLSLSLSAPPGPPVAGNGIAYGVVVANAGPSPARSTVIDFDLSAGQQVDGTSGCLEDPVGFPRCSLGDLPAGSQATISLSVTLPPSLTGTLTAAAAVHSDSTEIHPGNEQGSFSANVSQEADVTLVKDNGEAVARPGTSTAYFLTVHNSGPSDASRVVVTDLFPPELELCSWTCASSGSGSCTPGPISGPIEDLAAVPASGTVTYRASCTRALALPQGVLNQASAVPATPVIDPDPANNTAEDLDLPELIFLDGFETGDTSRWAAEVP